MASFGKMEWSFNIDDQLQRVYEHMSADLANRYYEACCEQAEVVVPYMMAAQMLCEGEYKSAAVPDMMSKWASVLYYLDNGEWAPKVYYDDGWRGL